MLRLLLIVGISEKMKDLRLDKFLADRLGCTRKESRILISTGNIFVNGIVNKDVGYKINSSDEVIHNGKKIDYGNKYYYFMINKPEDCVTATADNIHKTIFDLLPPSFVKLKIMPVGRLDIDTVGLLLFTNDGKLAYRLLSPKREVYKTYMAKTDKILNGNELKKFKYGIDIGDIVTKPARIVYMENNTYKLEICEGKFHQVKRMFEAVGANVIELKRTTFGPLHLDIPVGKYRELTLDEINNLYECCNLEKK